MSAPTDVTPTGVPPGTSGTVSTSHIYTVSGLYQLQCTLSDDEGGTDTSSCQVSEYDGDLSPPTATHEPGPQENTHTVTATVSGPGPLSGFRVLFEVTGQNQGATGTCIIGDVLSSTLSPSLSARKKAKETWIGISRVQEMQWCMLLTARESAVKWYHCLYLHHLRKACLRSMPFTHAFQVVRYASSCIHPCIPRHPDTSSLRPFISLAFTNTCLQEIFAFSSSRSISIPRRQQHFGSFVTTSIQ
jgi:hypothetical protein